MEHELFRFSIRAKVLRARVRVCEMCVCVRCARCKRSFEWSHLSDSVCCFCCLISKPFDGIYFVLNESNRFASATNKWKELKFYRLKNNWLLEIYGIVQTHTHVWARVVYFLIRWSHAIANEIEFFESEQRESVEELERKFYDNMHLKQSCACWIPNSGRKEMKRNRKKNRNARLCSQFSRNDMDKLGQ